MAEFSSAMVDYWRLAAFLSGGCRNFSPLITPRIQVEMTEAPAESPTSGVIEGHDVSVVMSFQFQV